MYVCIALYLCFVLLQKSFAEKDVEGVSVSLLCIVTEELRWERRWGCVCIFALYCYRRASLRKTLRVCLYLCFVLLQKSFAEKDVEGVSVSLLCIVTEELRRERRWRCVCIFALYCYRRASPRKTLRVCLYLCFVLLQKGFAEKDVEGVSVSLLCIVTEELHWERRWGCVCIFALYCYRRTLLRKTWHVCRTGCPLACRCCPLYRKLGCPTPSM